MQFVSLMACSTRRCLSVEYLGTIAYDSSLTQQLLLLAPCGQLAARQRLLLLKVRSPLSDQRHSASPASAAAMSIAIS